LKLSKYSQTNNINK